MPALASALTVADALQQPVWTALPDTAISYVNPYWCSYTGLNEADSLGNGWMDAVHPNDIPHLMAHCTASVENGTSYEITYRFRRADGV
jgi:PAS domain S-box-containing protein